MIHRFNVACMTNWEVYNIYKSKTTSQYYRSRSQKQGEHTTLPLRGKALWKEAANTDWFLPLYIYSWFDADDV